MNYQSQEHFLHKIVAASAFLCALCSLPVLQYVLVTSQVSATSIGQVAGATTSAPTVTTVRADIPFTADTSSCSQQRETQRSDLEKYATGTKIGLYNTYERQVKPYQDGLAALQGDPVHIDQERRAINSLIDPLYQEYQKKLAAVESAVASQKASIDSVPCR